MEWELGRVEVPRSEECGFLQVGELQVAERTFPESWVSKVKLTELCLGLEGAGEVTPREEAGESGEL